MMQFFRSFFPLFIAYCAGYTWWYQHLGAGFWNFKLLNFSHYLNPEWLRDDLWGALFLLHSQPPLMNFLIGVVFKIMPDYYEAVFRVMYFILGMAALWHMEKTFLLFGISRFVRALVFTCLLVTPTFYMMGVWLGTTHVEFCLTAIMINYLAEYMVGFNRNCRTLITLFVSFALLGLLRPQWHLVLFVFLACVMMVFSSRDERRKILLCSLVFIVPITGWYAKNEMRFGFFGPSSWVGSNIALVALQVKNDIGGKMEGVSPDFPAQFDMNKVLKRVKPADLGELPPVLQPFKSTDHDYLAYVEKLPKHAEYVKFNLNYLGLIASAQTDMQDAKKIIAAHPFAYIRRIITNMYETTKKPTYFHNSLTLNSAVWITPKPVQALSIYGNYILYAAFPLIVLAMFVFNSRDRRYQYGFILFCLAFYILLTSSAFNGNEGERMRWAVEPLYLLFAAMLLEETFIRLRKRLCA